MWIYLFKFVYMRDRVYRKHVEDKKYVKGSITSCIVIG